MRRARELALCLTMGCVLSAVAAAEAEPEVDLFGTALDAIERDRGDLGYRAKGYWNRFPLPEEMPHILPFFTDLFAEPLHIYDFTRTFAEATDRYLVADYRAANADALHRLLFYLGVSRRTAGFRAYSTNLAPPDSSDAPLLGALRSIYEQGGWITDAAAFGQRSSWPETVEPLADEVAAIPPDLQRVLADLLTGLGDAHHWWEIAVRNVPHETRQQVFRIRGLGESQPDGTVYYPEMDDMAALLDEESLMYAAIKAAAATERARAQLDSLDARSVLDDGDIDDLHFEAETPFGRVVLSGSDNDRHDYRDLFCLVDLGGDDHYSGVVGASVTPWIPISVALDYSGDDRYTCDEDGLATQGAGVVGAGVLLDASGDDRYESRNMSQGAALFGLGVLMDESGNDEYDSRLSSQGAGFFGIGLLLDGDGDDEFNLHGDGQGFGGVGGVGVLADAAGDDRYYCEPYAEKVGRADYHSDYLVAASHAQGVGSGRRGDGTDGHAWAGGLGVLVDLDGNDHYEAGNWAQGTGYWFGTGLLYDGDGDDVYRSVYFTQASGAHYAIGAIVDEAGDDRHELFENAGAGIAFGWDYTHALLFDRSGDDHYEAKIISLGLAEIRSNAFLVDLEGDDTYRLNEGQLGFGASDYREDYRVPDMRAPYNSYTACFGFLLDGGGKDRYLVTRPEGGGTIPHEDARNDALWLLPDRGTESWGAENFGVGLDCEGGVVPDWEPYAPVRATAP